MAGTIGMTAGRANPGVEARSRGPWARSTALGMRAAGSAFRRATWTTHKRLNFGAGSDARYAPQLRLRSGLGVGHPWGVFGCGKTQAPSAALGRTGVGMGLTGHRLPFRP